jgi:hypothetical protein
MSKKHARDDGNSSQSSKRQRSSTGKENSTSKGYRSHKKAPVNAGYGQSSAIPGLDDEGASDNQDDDTREALKYLRSVR